MTHEKEDCTPAHEREQLPAEKKFDQAVYGGISYAAQALTGMGLTYWIKHGAGKPIYAKLANWMGENFISKITNKSGAAAAKEADSWIVVTTMVMVGNAFILPVKWLENRKHDIVCAWTERDNKSREACGEVVSDAEKQKQQQLMDDLKDAPKQSWTSLVLGRGFALGAVYAVLHGIGQKRNEAADKLFSKTISKGFDTVGMKEIAKSKAVNNFTGIAFYDVFYSMISAGGLYVYSHFIHPKEKCPEQETPAPKLEAPKEEPTPSPTVSAPQLVKNSLETEKRPLVKHEQFTDYAAHTQPTTLGV